MRYFVNANFAGEFTDALFRTTVLSMLHALATYLLTAYVVVHFYNSTPDLDYSRYYNHTLFSGITVCTKLIYVVGIHCCVSCIDERLMNEITAD